MRAMARSRCDPFDVAAIRATIASGKTSERQAYLAYASTAGRPYARSTFSAMLRAKIVKPPLVIKPPIPDLTEPRWSDRAPVKPRILSLSPRGGLRVQHGSLVAFDGPMTLTYSPAAKSPAAIVLPTVGGYVSMEAVRWLARAGVALIALDRTQTFLTLIGGASKANAAMLRAQVEADPVPIARTIVATKIGAMCRAGALESVEPFMAALGRASSLDQIRIVEAQAARVAWPHAPLLRWDKGAVPLEWKEQWLARKRLDAPTPCRFRLHSGGRGLYYEHSTEKLCNASGFRPNGIDHSDAIYCATGAD
jgi:hypothetical protein